MAKFLQGNELNAELSKLIENAREEIILISPYIKLHDRYASALKTKKDSPKTRITLVFGKNEEDISKSMKLDDFNFFKEFPNIEIRYEKRLHAKYYANEETSILTSMNLYSFSQDNNIEAGVMSKTSILSNITDNLKTNITGEDSFDKAAEDYFNRVVKQSDLLFKRTPEFDSKLFGLSKKHMYSKTDIDKLTDFFENKPVNGKEKKNTASVHKPNKSGYCIRTGIDIPFNIDKPMSSDAYDRWNKFGNPDYPERYCHFTGEESDGETSMNKPILKKNWKKAKNIHDL